MRAGHLAAAVEAEVARVAGLVEPVLAWEDGRDARVDAVVLGGLRRADGLRVHEDAWDVGEGIVFAWGVAAEVEVGEDGTDTAASLG